MEGDLIACWVVNAYFGGGSGLMCKYWVLFAADCKCEYTLYLWG